MRSNRYTYDRDYEPPKLGVLTLILALMLIAVSITGISYKMKTGGEAARSEYLAISLFHYLSEQHIDNPVHQDWDNFMSQEKLYPGYYIGHILADQKAYDQLIHINHMDSEQFDFCVDYYKGSYQESIWHEGLTREQLEKKIKATMKRRGFTSYIIRATKKVKI